MSAATSIVGKIAGHPALALTVSGLAGALIAGPMGLGLAAVATGAIVGLGRVKTLYASPGAPSIAGEAIFGSEDPFAHIPLDISDVV